MYSELWICKFKPRSLYHISKVESEPYLTKSFYWKRRPKSFYYQVIFSLFVLIRRKCAATKKINTFTVMMIQKYFGNRLKIFRENIDWELKQYTRVYYTKFMIHSVSISLPLVSFLLPALQFLQLKSSSSLMSLGFNPIQKRCSQSWHLSHWTQGTCTPNRKSDWTVYFSPQFFLPASLLVSYTWD